MLKVNIYEVIIVYENVTDNEATDDHYGIDTVMLPLWCLPLVSFLCR